MGFGDWQLELPVKVKSVAGRAFEGSSSSLVVSLIVLCPQLLLQKPSASAGGKAVSCVCFWQVGELAGCGLLGAAHASALQVEGALHQTMPT